MIRLVCGIAIGGLLLVSGCSNVKLTPEEKMQKAEASKAEMIDDPSFRPKVFSTLVLSSSIAVYYYPELTTDQEVAAAVAPYCQRIGRKSGPPSGKPVTGPATLPDGRKVQISHTLIRCD